MTRPGVTILLVGLLIAGLGSALFLVFFVTIPRDPQPIFPVILLSWGVGGLLVLVGGVVALIGRLSDRRASP